MGLTTNIVGQAMSTLRFSFACRH